MYLAFGFHRATAPAWAPASAPGPSCVPGTGVTACASFSLLRVSSESEGWWPCGRKNSLPSPWSDPGHGKICPVHCWSKLLFPQHENYIFTSTHFRNYRILNLAAMHVSINWRSWMIEERWRHALVILWLSCIAWKKRDFRRLLIANPLPLSKNISTYYIFRNRENKKRERCTIPKSRLILGQFSNGIPALSFGLRE